MLTATGLGGVRLGMPMAEFNRLAGSAGIEPGHGGCGSAVVRDPAARPRVFVGVDELRDRVHGLSAPGAVTPAGVGVGSTREDVVAAYPSARSAPGLSGPELQVTPTGHDDRRVHFQLAGDRVTSLVLSALEECRPPTLPR